MATFGRLCQVEAKLRNEIQPDFATSCVLLVLLFQKRGNFARQNTTKWFTYKIRSCSVVVVAIDSDRVPRRP